jgi:two-component system, NtrC family, sensor kinase
MPRKLSLQIILSLTIIIVIVSGITGYWNVKREESQIIGAMIEGADQLSRSITSATWHSMLADHREDAYTIMQTIADEQGIDRIRYFNKEGEITFSTRPSDRERVDIEAEACILCHATMEPLVKVDTPYRSRIFEGEDGARKLAMVTPIYNEPACSQADCHAHPEHINVLGVLDVSLDLDRVDNEIRAAEIRNVITMILNVSLIGLFIFIFTRKFVDAPIKKLIRGTEEVSEMKLDKPIHIDSSVELEKLARSFNVMRERLALAMDELNEFTQHLEQKVDDRTRQLDEAHQKLLATDRLASLGQLAASVAHEINNPLYSILNLSTLMQRILKDDGIPADRLPEFRKHLTHVISETTRVGRIVTDLLAFSRRSRSQKSYANLNEIIKTTVSLLDHKLNLMSVSLDLRLDPKLPEVLCDPSQMQQVVINLVMNAAEATHDSDVRRVTISSRYVKQKDSVAIDVKDTGEGMSPELIDKIFDPFFTTKDEGREGKEGKGLGLGLAVVFGIIQSHRGDIEVDSTPGRGTTFTAYLPLSNNSDEQHELHEASIKSGQDA